jgi:cell division protease FtsH
MAYGGRVAEELVFGPDKITTGAAQDIEQATEMARRMVTQFGMSEVVGPIAVGDREQQIFLGREITQRREVSEKTAELVDAEVKRILQEAYQRARKILEGDRETLDRMARALLERETLDREEIELLAAGKELPARAPAGAVAATHGAAQPGAGKVRAPKVGPVLGTPPAKPAEA